MKEAGNLLSLSSVGTWELSNLHQLESREQRQPLLGLSLAPISFINPFDQKSFSDNSQQSKNNLRINQTTTQILQLNFYRLSGRSWSQRPQNDNFLSSFSPRPARGVENDFRNHIISYPIRHTLGQESLRLSTNCSDELVWLSRWRRRSGKENYGNWMKFYDARFTLLENQFFSAHRRRKHGFEALFIYCFVSNLFVIKEML
jgi:hypothetical protein